MTEQLLLTVEGAAEQLSIGRSRLYELILTGQIESVTIGRSRRIPRQALDDFVENLRAKESDSPEFRSE